jgi:hypothetical protein
MSESAWKLIVESYERELKNAKTPEEKARWQAAIDESLNEANKEFIISEGSIKSTRQEKVAEKARRISSAKNKKALEDVPGLIEEGKITYFPGHRQPDSNEAELLQSQFSQEREAQAKPKRINQDRDALAAAEDEADAIFERNREGKYVRTNGRGVPLSQPQPAPKVVNATNARTAEERQAILDASAARRQAAIDAGAARSNTPKPTSDSKQSVLNSIDRRQAAIDRARAKNQQKQVYDGVPEFETTGMPEADWTPLDDFSGNFVDDFVDNFENNPFHSYDDLLVPSHIDDVISSGERLAAVDQIGAELSPFRRRALSAVEQTMDLVADISHTAKSSTTAGVIEDIIPQTISNLKPVVQKIKNHNTAEHIIESMRVAQGAVKSMSRGKQAAIGIGSFAAIGAVSNKSLKKRRG